MLTSTSLLRVLQRPTSFMSSAILASRPISSSAVSASSRPSFHASRKLVPRSSSALRGERSISTSLTKSDKGSPSSPIYEINHDLPLQKYHTASNHAMESLTEYLEELIEGSENPGYDVEYSAGVLTLKIKEDAIYVINKQPPNQQIWLSSPISGPKRYDYSTEHGVWFYHRDNSTMKQLLDTELRVLMENEDVNVDLGENSVA